MKNMTTAMSVQAMEMITIRMRMVIWFAVVQNAYLIHLKRRAKNDERKSKRSITGADR